MDLQITGKMSPFTIASRSGADRGATSTPIDARAAVCAKPDDAALAAAPIAPGSRGAMDHPLATVPARSASPPRLQ
jgi:hypothetical protein